MKFQAFADAVSKLQIIDAGVLAAMGGDPASFAVQISRWVRAGKLIKLGRGRYLLAESYRRLPVDEDYLANLLRTPSYVSLERALRIHGMIPEAVGLVQSVTTGRPGVVDNSLGRFEYRHVKRSWFTGYREMQRGPGPGPLVATREKAILDLVYFSRGEFTAGRIEELRLDDVDLLDREEMTRLARLSGSARVARAARLILEIAGG